MWIFSPTALAGLQDQDGVTPLISGGDFAQDLGSDWTLVGVKGTRGKSEGRKSKKAFQVRALDPKSGGSIVVRTTSMVHLGDSVYLLAWLRDVNASEDRAEVKVVVAGEESPDKPLIDHKLKVGHEWKEYKFAADTHDYFLPGQLSLTFQFGAGAQIDLSNVRLQDMGDTPASSLAQTTEDAAKPKKKKGAPKGQ